VACFLAKILEQERYVTAYGRLVDRDVRMALFLIVFLGMYRCKGYVPVCMQVSHKWRTSLAGRFSDPIDQRSFNP
jgi:hypothetical protein